MEKNFVRAFATELAVTLRSGIASGNRVAAHIIINKHSLPLFVFGNGPTQSTITRSNGSPITGIGCRGAGGTTWFGLPASWHTCQLRQWLATSALSQGQKKCFNISWYVLVMPKCPDQSLSCATDNTCILYSAGTTT